MEYWTHGSYGVEVYYVKYPWWARLLRERLIPWAERGLSWLKMQADASAVRIEWPNKER